jgi:hypothetical protein
MVSPIDGSGISTSWCMKLMGGIDQLALLFHYADLPVQIFPEGPEGRSAMAKAPSSVSADGDGQRL